MQQAWKHFRLAALVLLAVGPAVTVAGVSDIYVSPAGIDSLPGTKERPLQTLSAAQKAERAARANGAAVTVHLLPGTYYLNEPIVFTAEDSGKKDAPVVWQADSGDVAISGGVKLDLKWAPYKDQILQAKVPAGLQTDQLFADGKRQILARYPNYDPNVEIFNGYAADCISPERVARWSDPTGGFMHAMHGAQWGGFSYLITGKDDKGGVKLEGGWQGNRPSGPHKTYRYVENIFEELDAPGEWFLNTKTATIYFYPPAGLDPAKTLFEVPHIKHLIEFRGTQQAPVKFVEVRGITLRHTLRTFMETKEPILRSDWTLYRGAAVFFNGAEDCTLADCYLDQVGGNAVMVNNYNRRDTIRGCRIEEAGGGGVTFVGDPAAVRMPLTDYNQHNTLGQIDRKPGPQTDNYPADCTVEDCLITRIGRWEKQSTGVGIDMSARITVRHCSIYDVPRAGINIGDGCWGGHVIEYCDVFDTVKETGDHGCFNSWGRDRYWGLKGVDLHTIMLGSDKDVPFLDCVETTTIRNWRWRCDHGWDIDLDDGSSNYHICNNLCLNGGLKNREGFGRVVENNIMVNNSFHPHVWFKDSGDIFRRNIVFTAYRPIGVPQPWGAEVDYNLFNDPSARESAPVTELQKASGRDEHSIHADAQFVDPATGNYQVKETSPALTLGFRNFPMDQFGVQKPALKAIAHTPSLGGPARKGAARSGEVHDFHDAKLRNILDDGEMSVYGTPGVNGVLVVSLPADHPFAKAGLKKDDVILSVGKKPAGEVSRFEKLYKAANAKTIQVTVLRKQGEVTIELPAGE